MKHQGELVAVPSDKKTDGEADSVNVLSAAAHHCILIIGQISLFIVFTRLNCFKNITRY